MKAYRIVLAKEMDCTEVDADSAKESFELARDVFVENGYEVNEGDLTIDSIGEAA